MPTYRYYCFGCTKKMDIKHSMDKKIEDCPACGAEKSLSRVPTQTQMIKKPTNEQVEQNLRRKIGTGEIVKEHIQDGVHKMSELKQKRDKRDYDPRKDNLDDIYGLD